jgi:hypothetical protein
MTFGKLHGKEEAMNSDLQAVPAYELMGLAQQRKGLGSLKM